MRRLGFRRTAPRELLDAVVAHHEVLVTAVRDRLPPPAVHDQVLRRVARRHEAARMALEHVASHSVGSTTRSMVTSQTIHPPQGQISVDPYDSNALSGPAQRRLVSTAG